mmetsp:Transcript_18665/g.47161  ORF Transcript_18665/g.47161 Transcript_18665/m.47161 type:complete len:208 (+) Transcript_18665:61-684(+)
MLCISRSCASSAALALSPFDDTVAAHSTPLAARPPRPQPRHERTRLTNSAPLAGRSRNPGSTATTDGLRPAYDGGLVLQPRPSFVALDDGGPLHPGSGSGAGAGKLLCPHGGRISGRPAAGSKVGGGRSYQWKDAEAGRGGSAGAVGVRRGSAGEVRRLGGRRKKRIPSWAERRGMCGGRLRARGTVVEAVRPADGVQEEARGLPGA